MRRLMYILSALIFAACSKDRDVKIVGTSHCRIRLECDGASLKSGETIVGEAYESAINNLQVLVFDRSGVLEKYLYYDSTPPLIETDLKYGNASLHVFANYPDLSSIMKRSQLSSFWIPIYRNNESNGLIMYGNAMLAVPAQTEASVQLERLSARMTINEIDIALPTVAATSALVPSNTRIIGGASRISADGSETIADDAISYPINGTPPYLFYVYPVYGSSARLIVEADFEGATQYYPVDVGEIEKNTAYSLSLFIRSLGSPDPDADISESTNDVRLSVSRWASGASFTENH